MADLNRRFSDNDPCWLMKVDSRIMGPLSFNEIVLKLTSSEFKPFHECISPMDRWRPLQSQPLFIAAVEKLKKQKTEAAEFTFTRTERTSFTRTLDATNLTPTPAVTPSQEDTPIARFESSQNLEIVRGQNKTKAKAPVMQDWSPSVPQKNIPIVFYIAPFVLMLVAFIILLVFKTKKEVAPVVDIKSQFLALVDKGLEHKKIADWSEALKYFRKAQTLNGKDADLIFEMAPLFIQVENQSMMARGLLEKVMNGQYKRENVVLGHTLIGLSYAYDNQYKMAIRYYDEALKNEETYFPALVNRGLALTMSERYDEAERALNQALEVQPNNAIAYLYLIESYIFQGLKTKNKALFEKADTLAHQISDRFYDGKQEVLFLQSVAAYHLGKDFNTVIGILKRALKIDPDQTADHLHSPIIDWRGLQWSYFHQICNEFSNVTKNDEQFFIKFICAYKMNSEIQALQVAEGWSLKSPHNPTPQIAQAIVRNKLGENEKAQLSLEIARQMGANDALFFQMETKVCSKLKDSKCLRYAIEKMSNVAPLHSYLAKATEAAINGVDNRHDINTGLRESNNYIPLLRMQ